MEANRSKYHVELKSLIDEHVNLVYLHTKKFPKDEAFGMTSQLRRAALSVMLNYIEGYARRRKLVLVNFLEISYGSLKESIYITYLAEKQSYISKPEWELLDQKADRIGKMLWGILNKIS